MVLKPHHFMDIIKLYGTGIDVFTPDLEYGHDFYMAANEIVKNHNTLITFTDGADDICGPCRCLGTDGICQDSISHVKGITSKDRYNKLLDQRIMKELGVNQAGLTAEELCRCMGKRDGLVEMVWKEEDEEKKSARKLLFAAGVEKYLSSFNTCPSSQD